MGDHRGDSAAAGRTREQIAARPPRLSGDFRAAPGGDGDEGHSILSAARAGGRLSIRVISPGTAGNDAGHACANHLTRVGSREGAVATLRLDHCAMQACAGGLLGTSVWLVAM